MTACFEYLFLISINVCNFLLGFSFDWEDILNSQVNKLTSVFYASVLLLIMNFVITLSK